MIGQPGNHKNYDEDREQFRTAATVATEDHLGRVADLPSHGFILTKACSLSMMLFPLFYI